MHDVLRKAHVAQECHRWDHRWKEKQRWPLDQRFRASYLPIQNVKYIYKSILYAY